jgi:hypothetical protein
MRTVRRAVAHILTVLVLVAGAVTSAGAQGEDPGPNDPVIGVSLGGIQRAYPLAVFVEEQVINDQIGRHAVAVFYDRGSDLAAAWFRLVGGDVIEFSPRAAGPVADDLTTATRWDIGTGEGVGGNLVGVRLAPVKVRRMTLAEWRKVSPKTTVWQKP